MEISIAQAQRIREELGATHLVLYALDAEGENVATHGESPLHALQAAQMGNSLKLHLGWPPEFCESTPLPRVCANCRFFKPSSRSVPMLGITPESTYGQCLVEPAYHERLHQDPACRHFQPNA